MGQISIDGRRANDRSNPEQQRLESLLGGQVSYSTADIREIDGAPSLSIVVPSPGGDYGIPLFIAGVQRVGAEVSRRELSDWLGDEANSVPDGTPVVSVVVYLGEENFSPVIRFPHTAPHRISTIGDWGNIGQASTAEEVKVSSHNGAANPDGSWSSKYFPLLQQMELGYNSRLFLVADPPRFDIGENPGMVIQGRRLHYEPCNVVFKLGLYSVGLP